jgi:hypothetical protein
MTQKGIAEIDEWLADKANNPGRYTDIHIDSVFKTREKKRNSRRVRTNKHWIAQGLELFTHARAMAVVHNPDYRIYLVIPLQQTKKDKRVKIRHIHQLKQRIIGQMTPPSIYVDYKTDDWYLKLMAQSKPFPIPGHPDARMMESKTFDPAPDNLFLKWIYFVY